VYPQALLPPCIAELSKLPLRELSLKTQQFRADSAAAFWAPFQQLPQTLRQLSLHCTPSYRRKAVLHAEPLPPAPPPARLQTTALRQVCIHDKLLV
jgi:hypothetical protein